MKKPHHVKLALCARCSKAIPARCEVWVARHGRKGTWHNPGALTEEEYAGMYPMHPLCRNSALEEADV